MEYPGLEEAREYKIMSDEITVNPYTWSLEGGNMIPLELEALADTTPFTATNCTLSVESAETIDGHSLRKLKVKGSW